MELLRNFFSDPGWSTEFGYGSNEAEFIVVSVHRYKRTANFPADVVKSTSPDTNVFDLVLTDSTYQFKLKVVLAQNLNLHIYSENVVPGSVIVLVGDDVIQLTTKSGSIYVVEYLISNHKTVQVPTDIPFLDDSQTDREPLIRERGAYLHLKADGDYLLDDPKWLTKIDTFDGIVPESIFSIRELLKLSRQNPKKFAGEKLVGRVQSKSSILYHGSDSGRFPYRFTFEIGDISGSVKCTVWNNVVFRYFRGLNVGDLVLIEGFRVKVDAEDALEVAINPSNPRGLIYKLYKPNFSPWKSRFSLRYPKLSEPFYDILELPIEPSFITGRVQYVGPPVKHVSEDGSFNRYRWIRVFDTTGSIFVKLYSNSQTIQFEAIECGFLVRLLVKYRLSHGKSQEDGFAYAYTTRETQIELFSDAAFASKHPHKAVPRLQDLPFYQPNPWLFSPPLTQAELEPFFEDDVHSVEPGPELHAIFIKMHVGERKILHSFGYITATTRLSHKMDVLIPRPKQNVLEPSVLEFESCSVDLLPQSRPEWAAQDFFIVMPCPSQLEVAGSFDADYWLDKSIDVVCRYGFSLENLNIEREPLVQVVFEICRTANLESNIRVLALILVDYGICNSDTISETESESGMQLDELGTASQTSDSF